MVKRLVSVLICIALVALCAACTPKEKATEAQMLTLTESFCEPLRRNDPSEAFRASTISLQYTMQEQTFVSMWETAIDNYGQLISDYGVVMTRWDSGECFVVDYAFQCSRIGLVTRILFNEYAEMTDVTIYPMDLEPDTFTPDYVIEEPFELTCKDGIRVHGMLCFPKMTTGKLPTAILLPGAGAASMDCDYGKVRFMRDMAYGLAQQGIATLRMNKVTYENTQISALTYTVDSEYIQPYTAAYDLLCADERVDSERIVLLGHDLGASVAPRLSVALKDGISSMILLAGTARPLYELHYDQNLQYLSMHPEMSDRSALIEQLSTAEKIVKKRVAFEAQSETAFGYNGIYYWEYAQEAPDLSQISIPVFLARGLSDFQNYEADWNSLVNGLTNADVTQKQYEGLSHLFTPALGNDTTIEYFQQAQVDSHVIDDIAQFILQ